MTIEDQSIEEEVDKYTQINEDNLDSELATCASLHFRASCLAIDAELMHEQAILSVEIYEAELANKIKTRLSSESGRTKADKVTETEIKREYRADPKWVALTRVVMEQRRNWKILEKGAKSIEMKLTAAANLNKRQIFKKGQHIGDL